jgi:hypothetical protein
MACAPHDLLIWARRGIAAQRAGGAVDESSQSFELAHENLEATLGPEHYLTQQVSGLLSAH